MGKLVGEAKTNLWLHAAEIRQPGKEWTKVSSGDCWMPFAIQRFILEEVKNDSSL